MFFSVRIPLKTLAQLCRRLAVSLTAGIDARTTWAREAANARGRSARRHLTAVSEATRQGESLSAALAATGDYFPPLLHEMVDVGEQSGHTAEIFAQLADHYQYQLEMRRMFLGAITWPMLELAAAVGIIGALIWGMGLISEITGQKFDMLGWGLVGNRGLAIYAAGVTAVAVAVALLIRAVRRGVFWTRPLQRGVLRLPVLGRALQTLALSHMAWSMYLTMNAGMELRRSLRLSLRSTRSARYIDQIPVIEDTIGEGDTIHEAFRRAGVFPYDFLDALDVGERSGKLVESMAMLSRQYQEQARAALVTLTKVAGYAVWMLVALAIIAVIFRLFIFYVNTINSVMPR
jgi:type IV pilus assembly protein PilC